MGLKDVITSAPALQEFGTLAKAVQSTMTDHSVSRKTKRNILNDLVNTLSEKTFNNSLVANQIIIIINMKEDVCKEYKDSESQVNGILEWLPRMAHYKDKLLKVVSKNRKQYGLKI